MPAYRGGCHCGAADVVFETEAAPDTLVLRACQCSFCRRHGARTVTDPGGHLRISWCNPAAAVHYRFGLRTADFLLCGHCGVYIAAVIADGDKHFATLNVNTLGAGATFAETAEPVSYDGETAAERMARRRLRWTPTTLQPTHHGGAP